jgi:hypothetical protein
MMCPRERIVQAEADGFTIFCPVSVNYPNAVLVGIARMRYRPHTRFTAEWGAGLQSSGGQFVRELQEIMRLSSKISAVNHSPAITCRGCNTSRVYQGISRVFQRATKGVTP